MKRCGCNAPVDVDVALHVACSLARMAGWAGPDTEAAVLAAIEGTQDVEAMPADRVVVEAVRSQVAPGKVIGYPHLVVCPECAAPLAVDLCSWPHDPDDARQLAEFQWYLDRQQGYARRAAA